MDDVTQLIADSLRVSCEFSHYVPVPAGYSTGWRILTCAVVSSVVEGTVTVEIDDNPPLQLGGGTGICIPAGVNHRFSHHHPGVAASAHINFRLFGGIDVLSLVHLPHSLGPDTTRRLIPMCRELGAVQRSGRGLLSIACAVQALGLNLLCAVLDASTIEETAVERLRAIQRVSPALYAAERDLGSIDQDRMAALMGLSRSRLHEVFHAAVGCAPMAYIRRRRMTRACDLLIGTDLPIAQVAQEAGFGDPYHFSRAFAKAQGMSPSRYRTSLASRIL